MNGTLNRRDQPLLVVEDSPEDYEATLRAFRQIGLSNPIYHCSEGEEALDYLYQRGAYLDPLTSPRPGVILLDLNLPGTDGRDVLREIKLDENLKMIPVIIFTSSRDERDIEACYRSGANSYMQKPIGLDDFFKVMELFKKLWFEVVILPRVK